MSDVSARPADAHLAPEESATARDRLLSAAIEAFAAKGFHGTTTRDIATAAGLSPAAVYVHHRSKEDLLYLISKTGHQRTLDLVRAAAATSADPVEQLAAVMQAFVLSHAREHTRARIVNYELAALAPHHLRTVAGIRRAIDAEVGAIVAAGVESGAFSTPDPHMTTLAVLSMGIDVARWFRDDGTWTGSEVADHYTVLALRMVGVPAGRATVRKGTGR
ncbi:MAG: TetR/AcrR family transcriptional regulator [Jatrophihabitans sp.]